MGGVTRCEPDDLEYNNGLLVGKLFTHCPIKVFKSKRYIFKYITFVICKSILNVVFKMLINVSNFICLSVLLYTLEVYLVKVMCVIVFVSQTLNFAVGTEV